MAPAAAQTAQTAPGYQPLYALSDGGMGKVELAVRQEGRFRRLHAIKRLHDGFRNDEHFRKMFLDEGRIAGLIRHPNVVSVVDVGEDALGPYLVMDFVRGVPLSTLIGSCGPLDIQVALRIVRDVALGLHAAHELVDHDGQPLELVHRDISPQNIMLSYEGSAQVTDFGIAKALGASTRTATGVLKGKFGYMSPEQLSYGDVDRRSDLFALGVVFHELLSGERLYQGGPLENAPRRILHEPPPDLGDARPDAPAGLVELVFSMLAKDPDERPDTAAEVASRLELLLSERVAFEGVYELREYIEDALAEPMAADAERLAEALKGLDAPEKDAVTPLPARASRGMRLAIGGATFVLALAGGAWGGIAFFGAEHAPDATAPPVSSLAPPPSAVVPAAAAPPSEMRIADDAPAEAAEAASEPSAETEAPLVAEPTAPPRPRPRRRRRATPRREPPPAAPEAAPSREGSIPIAGTLDGRLEP